MAHVLAILPLVSTVWAQDFILRQVQLSPAVAEAELAKHPEWIRVSRSELEKLLKAVQSRKQNQSRFPVVVHAHYQARWEDGALVGTGRWQVWAWDDQPTWLACQPFSLAVRPPVRVNGQPSDAGVGSSGEFGIALPGGPRRTDAPTSVSPSGREYQIEFDWSVSLERRGNEQVASLQIPPALLTTLHLEAPTNFRVNLRGAEASLSKKALIGQKRDWVSYEWALDPGSTRFEWVLSSPAGETSSQRLYVDQKAQHTLDSSSWQSSYQVSLETSGAGLSTVRLFLPAGTQVQSVQERLRGVDAIRWVQDAQPQGTILTAHLLGGERRAELEIVCRAQPLRWGSTVQFALATVDGATSQLSTMTIRWRQGLTLSGWAFGDFQPQHPPQLSDGDFWQLTLGQSVPGLLGVAGFPRAIVRRQTPEVAVQAEFRCQLGIRESRMEARLFWEVRSGTVFRLGVRIPDHWVVEDSQISSGKDADDWLWRNQGNRLWAERKSGTLKAGATVSMNLRLRSSKPEPDFSRPGDWPLPEVVPEQATWAEATWYLTLERLRDGQGRTFPPGVLWPGQPWTLQPKVIKESTQVASDYAFVGPLPTGARMRVRPLPSLKQVTLETRLDLASSEVAVEPTSSSRSLHVRLSVTIEPVSGLVDSLRIRFPGQVPDLDWKIVAGETRIRQTQRHLIVAEHYGTQHTWTVFEWTFDRPLIVPTRLEADWLSENPSDKPANGNDGSAPAYVVPLPCGEAPSWWHGRVSCGPNIPPNWELLLKTFAGAGQTNLIPLTALPHSYTEPAQLQMRTRSLTVFPPVLEGALLGITWNGQEVLQCDYWAWTRSSNWTRTASSSEQPVPKLSLRLPPGATLRYANVWCTADEMALPADQVQADDAWQITFTAPQRGPVVFHVRYTQPVDTLLCLAQWPEVAPAWEGPVTVLGHRIWVCLPESWVPLALTGKVSWGQDFSHRAMTALQTEIASPVRSAILSWLGQETTKPTNFYGGEVNGFAAALSYSGFTWWELSDSAGWTGKVWVRLDHAHVVAALLALVIGALAVVLLRWTPRIGFAVMIAVLLISCLGLIWLPRDLAMLSFWPLGALGLSLCSWIRAQTRTNHDASPRGHNTAWFIPSNAAGTVCWLAIALSLAFGGFRHQGVLADELAEQTPVMPNGPLEAKEPPVVIVFHYVEEQGDQERHWALVPLKWWQHWQQLAHERPLSPSWLITASKWEIDASHAQTLNNRRASAVAIVQWELGVTLLSQEATIPLQVSGIRWQSATEVDGAEARAVDLRPLGKGDGLSVHLRGVGQHKLRLVGQVDIRQSGQSLQINWRIPPMPLTELRAIVPASARYIECVGGRFRQSLLTKHGPDNQPVWESYTELGPVGEIHLSWQIPDQTSPQWHAEEFHWLRVEKQEVVWNTVSRIEVTRGQIRELRFRVSEAYLVSSVEARDGNGVAVPISSWQVRSTTYGKELTIQFARPVSANCLVRLEYIVDTRAGSALAVWQKAHVALSVLCPHSPALASLFWWQPAYELEKRCFRRLTLLLPVPYVLGQGRHDGAWLIWDSHAAMSVRVMPRTGLKPMAPTSELLNRWPANWLPVPQSGPAEKSSQPRIFQVLTPAARLLVQATPATSRYRVKHSLVLEADSYQLRMSLDAELQSELGSLPATLVAQLPAGWRITKVAGKHVSEWQQEGNHLRIWLQAGQQRTSLTIGGITSISGPADRRTFHVRALQFPDFRAEPGSVELSAASGLKLQIVKSQGLNLLEQSENKLTYEALEPTYTAIVELQAVAPRVTAQLTSTLRREPYWWWETQIECRSSSGPIRNLVVHVQRWSGAPPLVISEELHDAQVEALPDGQGYRVHLQFPDAASLSDQTVRFRIAGRLSFDGSSIPVPLIYLPEAQAMRHRLTAWPRNVRVENAIGDGDAWRLPAEPDANPAVLHLTSAAPSPVRLVFAQVDIWRNNPEDTIVQLTCWLAHPPHAWLAVNMPPESTLLQALQDDQPVPWQTEGQEAVRLPLMAPTGFSRLCLVWRCSNLDVSRPLPELNGRRIEAVWLQHWLPVHEAVFEDDTRLAQRRELAWVGALVNWLADELQAPDSHHVTALIQPARALSELLQADDRVGDIPLEISKRWQELRQQYSRLTASPRFEPVRRALSQQTSSQKPVLLTAPLPFLAAQARGQSWSNSESWPVAPAGEAFWRAYATAGTATVILLVSAGAFLAAVMFPLGRIWISRLAPESLLVLAGFWVVFLEPRWAASLLVLLGLYWRLRRWRASRLLLYSEDFTINSVNSP